MEQVTDRSARELQHQLGGLVYRNPEGAWETADRYLSGDVRRKQARGSQGAHRRVLGQAPRRTGCRRRSAGAASTSTPSFRRGSRLFLDRRAWRNVNGDRPGAREPLDAPYHLGRRQDEGGHDLDGRLDVEETPEGVSDGVLGGGLDVLRLGGHTWHCAPNLNGLLDEVRVSSVVREYRPLPGRRRTRAR